MSSSSIGKIQRVPLREIWRHEALGFTRWLQENLDILSDVLDFSLTNAEREQSAGDFAVDLVAEDESGNIVVIENQLEKSNHDHLGKLITYLVAVEAKAAVWIVADPRPEHVRAITWLNESVAAAFYMVKVEGIRIGESPSAPLLTLIVGPSEEGREVGETKKELAERYILRKRFWQALLDRAKPLTKLHSGVSAGHYSYIGTGAGKSGLGFTYVIWQHEAAVELYIDRGKGAEAENKAIFDALLSRRLQVEEGFGGPLEWQRLDEKRACRIRRIVSDKGYLDEESWERVQHDMIDAMIRLERALRPLIAQLQV